MDLKQLVFSSGVVGAGGAGFPTHKKLVENVELLIINAVECEPLLFTDRTVTKLFSKEIISSLLTIKKEMKIKSVVIGIKRKYHEEIKQLENAIAMEKAEEEISIFKTDSFYPIGDEQSLIYEITGKSITPGNIPLSLGIVVLNITTVFNIYNGLNGKPVTHKYITVTGEVENPCVIHVPIGTSIGKCIKIAGGSKIKDYMVILGGPLMGKYKHMEELENTYVTKTDGGIIIIPKDHYLPTFRAKKLEYIINQAKSVCIQCSYCTEQCPRYLLGHKIRPNRVMRSVSTNTNPKDLTEALLCCECGVCELYSCPMGLSPRQVNIYIKKLLRETGIGLQDKNIYEEQTLVRQHRKIPQSRFMQRLDIEKYYNHMEEVVVFQGNSVSIPLKQGIGKMANPVVSVGDKVKVGDLIGSIEYEDMGSQVHSSINGKIISIDNNIVISGEEENI